MSAGSSPRCQLPRERRLQLGRDFARLKAQGGRIARGCLVLNWLERAADEAPRVGIVTSRKVGGATERTRARRLLRETFRLHQHDFARPVDVVLVARSSIAGRKFAEVETDFLAALRLAKLLK
ncbi:MAG: ribonuclease P protein component [Verrucomicrobia bacterium]|nr:ribonuclease P protein component [Verrucomicrobiota bacterium]